MCLTKNGDKKSIQNQCTFPSLHQSTATGNSASLDLEHLEKTT